MSILTLEPTRPKVPTTKKGQFVFKKQSENVNSYSRTYENSPTFSFTSSELTSGQEEVFDFFEDKPKMRKYGAMNILTISNSGSQSFAIYPNQDKHRFFNVPAGTIRVLTEDDLNAGLLSFTLENTGSGTASANDVVIETYKRGVSQESITKNIHKKLFRFGRF